MESYGLEMDDLFDNNDISQDLDEFENPNVDNSNPDQENAADSSQNNGGKWFTLNTNWHIIIGPQLTPRCRQHDNFPSTYS